MRKTLPLGLIGLAFAASTVVFVAPAQAASGGYAVINAIADQPTVNASASSTALVRPNVTRVGKVVVKSSKITVKLNGATLTTKASSIHLKYGTYVVRTYVKYRGYKTVHGKRVYSRLKSKAASQVLHITRPCATTADYETVIAAETVHVNGDSTEAAPDAVLDTQASVARKLHSPGAGTGPVSFGPFFSVDNVVLYPKCDSSRSFGVVYGEGVAQIKLDLNEIDTPPSA